MESGIEHDGYKNIKVEEKILARKKEIDENEIEGKLIVIKLTVDMNLM